MRNVIVFIIVLFISTVSVAQIPSQISYQGFITDLDGPITNPIFPMEFRICEDVSGIVTLWQTDGIVLVEVDGGYFTHLLGSANPLPDSLSKYSELWLGITAGGDSEMPLIKIASTAYSYKTIESDLLDGKNADAFADTGHAHVVTSAEIEDGTIQFIDIGQNGADADQLMKWNGSGWVAGNDETGGGWVDDGNVLRMETSTDSVGIGTATPTEKLEVIGNIKASGTITAGNSITIDGVNDKITASGGTLDFDNENIVTTGKATIGPGHTNTGLNAFVAGMNNIASGENCAVGGGIGNTASGISSTVGGGNGNAASVTGCTVGGGENNTASLDASTVGGGNDNTASGDYSTIAGGESNEANGAYTTIGGGYYNLASLDYATVGGGMYHSCINFFATVGGGESNLASGWGSTVGGGVTNSASGGQASVGGGWDNTASGDYASVGGGWGNTASGNDATVGGGKDNNASYYYSFIGGGLSNTTIGGSSFIGGGWDNLNAGDYSAISGGYADTITATADYSYLFGIASKLTADSTFMVDMPHIRFGDEVNGYEFPAIDGATGQVMATDGSGQLNWTTGSGWVDDGNMVRLETIADFVGIGTTTPSEKLNVVGNILVSGKATIGAGHTNTGTYASIGGGSVNTASGDHASVGGGFFNTASGDYASVGGGANNTASGSHSAVFGGYRSVAGSSNSLAAGNRAKANHYGSIVLAANSSNTNSDSVRSGGNEQMVLRADGGLYITNTGELAPYDNTKIITTRGGAYLSGNGTTWTNASDRNIKENFGAVDNAEILEKIASLPISEWNYKEDDESVRHIGPVAQDFHALFGLGEDDKHISTIDPSGVALAGVKELIGIIENQNIKIEELENKIAELEENLN